MEKKKLTIDNILKQWPFDPLNVNVRLLESRKRQVLQMRVDMGILQLEVDGRPDGHRFSGAATYYEFLRKKAAKSKHFSLTEDNCLEVDREFVQFYHRRVCWLQLKKFAEAVRDADHTLSLMDFCKMYSPDESWTVSHEQYRPFVLYHRTQAAALAHINDDVVTEESDSEEQQPTGEEAESAINEVNLGLSRLHDLFVEYDAEEQFDDDELVQRLTEFREGIRQKHEVGLTLDERLQQAIAAEDYELAAELRDRLALREFD